MTIETRVLSVTEGAQVSVRNDGTGDGGTLRLQAASIFLDGASGITASTKSGEGGNIAITSNDIRLRGGSEISATAGGTGNGGNISLATETLVLREGSRIASNAVAGRGGNIQISADGVFVSPDSEITASSQLGIDGTVEIETQQVLERLPVQTADRFLPTEELIAQSCLTHTGEPKGSFAYTGAGGLPITPESGIDQGESVIAIPRPPQGQ